MQYCHIPVLLDESIEGLSIKPDGFYMDGTLGGGGHSLEIAKRLKNGILVGVDRDENAINKASSVLEDYGDKVRLVRSNFADTGFIQEQSKIKGFDGILLDLGTSSHQLDEPSRGFSYNNDSPLDMRMDNRQKLTAMDIINGYPERELSRIIFEYGEERWAKRIAEFIIAERTKNKVETTFQLVDIIKKAIPKGAREDGPHPAKRTFQAIRIEVNGELSILEHAIGDLVNMLNPGGRICIITFHSLEDRIVKNAFRDHENPCTCPRDFPKCFCGKKPVLSVITRKPILPSKLELENNHRSRSAKLRIAEKNEYKG